MKYRNLSSEKISVWAVLASSAVGAAIVLSTILLGGDARLAIPMALGIAGIVGVLVFGFGLLLRKANWIHNEVTARAEQNLAWTNVRPALGAFPVRLGEWAMDPLFAEQIAMAIAHRKPRVVVECGSGSSSVLIASCLDAIGEGQLVSLDDDAEYASQTRQSLNARGLGHRATVLHAPLGDVTVDGELQRWYTTDLEQISGPIDLLIVDGPPATSSRRARYPAVPLLEAMLAPEAVVLMDDGARPDETWIAARWAERLGGQAVYVDGGKGGWIITRTPPDK